MKSETWIKSELAALKIRIKNPRLKDAPVGSINAQTKYAALGKISILEEILEGEDVQEDLR